MNNYVLYQERRKKLLDCIRQESWSGEGAVVLCAGLESERYRFRQESSFYYFTGITEPGVVLIIDFSGKTTLYIPDYGGRRATWVERSLDTSAACASSYGVDSITYAGAQIKGYAVWPFFGPSDYSFLLKELSELVNHGKKIYTLAPQDQRSYVEQRFFLARLNEYVTDMRSAYVDISACVAALRRCKDPHEIEQLFKAVRTTVMAHEGAVQVIKPGVNEADVQAAIEFVFHSAHNSASFPSIIGSGPNSTILHYGSNNRLMHDGDLVVVDIGADHEYYCADITRTYPVSGVFTDRQREIYDIVLAAQQYIADIAKPGMWLNNADHQDASLNHLAHEYIKQSGYGEYFPHGIGHYLGIDVHDVGSLALPLAVGDVITIEPGIYIPSEGIGVRIEDDFWVVADGVMCLSEDLPRTASDIEEMMARCKEEPGVTDEAMDDAAGTA